MTSWTSKKGQSCHTLSVGNQTSMEMGPLYMDSGRFVISDAVKQLLTWWITRLAVEIAHSDDGTVKEKHWISPFLVLGNQMSMAMGPLHIDREIFKVFYSVKQLLTWWITRKAIEIAHSNDSTILKKCQVWPFLVLGDQMSTEMGPLHMDRERFEVIYSDKQLLTWWITKTWLKLRAATMTAWTRKSIGSYHTCPLATKWDREQVNWA